jgi:hypothetical protein
MNLKTPLLTAAALLVAMAALASPAQAYYIPNVRNPCDNMMGSDPETQAIINQCRQADDQVYQLANEIVALILNNLPDDGQLPDICSTQENVVPFVLECAAWAINQVPPPPGSGEIVEKVNELLAEVGALAQWAQDYALVDLAGWYDATGSQAATDVGALGTWVLAQEGYSNQVGAYANGVAGQALVDAGRESTYATATAGQASADANALAAYINCRLFSPVPCGNAPTPHAPGVPPTPTVPGVPPTPGMPPVPTVPSVPPTPHDPPL